MMGHSICFMGVIRKIIMKLSLLPLLKWSSVYNMVFVLKYSDGMANSVDPDQTAPFILTRSG